MKYAVILECGHFCEDYEPRRITFQTDIVDEAIRQSAIHRDNDHYSWVEINKDA